MVILAMGGGLALFLLSRRVWGDWGGIVSLCLYSLCPNILAHGQLVTMDVPVAAFLLLASYFLWDHIERPAPWKPLAVGAALGLALLAKFSAIFSIPAIVLIVLATQLRGGFPPAGNGAPGRTPARAKTVLAAAGVQLALIAAPTVALCVAGYLWPLKPLAYIKGMLEVNRNHIPGYEFYFWGQYSPHRFLLYFPGAFLLKTPLPTLALLGGALACLRKRSLGAAFFVLSPAVCLLAATMALADDIGVRYLMPVYAFLYLFAGILGSREAPWPRLRAVAVPALLIALAFSAIRAYPNYIPFFNLAAGGPRGGTRFLDDSNVDWGQDGPVVTQFLEGCDGPLPRVAWCTFITPMDFGAKARNLLDCGQEFIFPVATMYLVSAHVALRPDVQWIKRFMPCHCINGSVYVFRFAVTDTGESHFDAKSGTQVLNEIELCERGLALLEEPEFRSTDTKAAAYGLRRLGEAYRRTGRTSDARQSFERLKAIPGFEAEANRLLASLN